MNGRLLLLVPGLWSCGGLVELGAVEVGPDPGPVDVVSGPVPRVLQMAPWAMGMCGLFDDQRVRCWDYNTPDDVWVAPGLTGVALAATDDTGSHGRICTISETGTMTCVVADCASSDLELPDSCLPRLPSYEVQLTPPVVSASLFRWGGAALRADGTFQAWGEGIPKCFGPPVPPDDFTDSRPEPYNYDWAFDPVALPSPIVALDHGFENTCMVTADGRVYCTVASLDKDWPSCAWPPVPVREIEGTTSFTVPPKGDPLVQDAIAVVADLGNACILHRTGRVTCYGPETYLGIGSTDNRYTSAEVATIDDAILLEGTMSQMCVVRSDGSLWCWGSNYSGELGAPLIVESGPTPPDTYDNTFLFSPRKVEGVSDVRVVGMAGGYTCVGEGDGDIWCLGWPSGPTPYRIMVPPTL